MFNFSGSLEISKSWMNRALVIQSFDPQNISITGTSLSEDVVFLQKALSDLKKGRCEFYAGLGGTTFRFLALRLSREVGKFFVKAEPALLARPQSELLEIFSQLGVKAELNLEGIWIDSQGWQEPSRILKISTRESSQFLSAVLLSAIDLDFDLHIMIEDEFISEDYFEFTLQMLEECGIATVQFEDSIFLKKSQKLKPQRLIGEVDVSSVFTLAASAVLAGCAEIKNWKSSTTQPDIQFLNFFERMGIRFEQLDSTLKIHSQKNFKGLEVDLVQCPDLFPVLSVLCAFANGSSRLYGAPQLKYKESDRISKTAELLSRCGFKVETADDGIKIQGCDFNFSVPTEEIVFDSAHDHRMAMAAAIMKLQGFPVRILHPEVVNKSYPHFYQHVGLNL